MLRPIWYVLAALIVSLPAEPATAQRPPVVRNPAPNPDKPAFRLSTNAVFALGLFDRPGERMTGIKDAVINSAGRLLVAPSLLLRPGQTPSQLRVFASPNRGELAFGLPGDGPRQFRTITRVWTIRDDSIVVFDNVLKRVSIFDKLGRLHRHLFLSQPGICCFDDWRYLVGVPEFPRGMSQARTDGRGLRDTMVLSIAVADDRQTPPREILRLANGDPGIAVPSSPSGVTMLPDTLPEMTGRVALNIAAPFGRRASVEITDRSIVYGLADTYEYRVYSRTGELERIVQADAAPVPLTPAILASWHASRSGSISSGFDSLLMRQFATYEFPATLPAYTRLLAERDGTVWVQGYVPPGTRRHWWARFDRNGKLLGTIELPEDMNVVRFINGYAILASAMDPVTRRILFLVHRIENANGR